ncbi:dopamine receptor 2-like [Uranotaenia lowii]|uniref:dopamine receptor 2-like n=1 Tax=Uranotaenia lowii TaxID=190385 RepID=UPI002478A2A0|nr:dopamine receptor 2-like [Uranotaenia lowii]
MMNNASDFYWELSQLIRLSNLSYYNVSGVDTVTSPADVANCCTTEPDFSEYLEALPNDKAGLLGFLFLFSFATVFGNSLVILAVIRERYLHTATNYFVTSLAVADCLVGLVVMPFSALYEILHNTWFFGEDWCDIWRSLDVLFSTASILNLCVISLDRYWAITDPFSYPMKMTRRKAAALIAAVWICSSAISFPAILWWRSVREEDMPAYKCPFTENMGYLVFSSTISFYLPLLVMVFTYCRIYRAAAIQTRSLRLGTKQVLMASGELQLTLRIHRGGTTRERPNHPREHHPSQDHQNQQHTANSTPEEPDEEPLSALQNNGLGARHRTHMGGKNFSLSRKLAKFAKEKKAAKTLGIVMGVFIVCWLPFFVFNLLSGFCPACIAHEEIVSAVVTWLGWINSSMNPVIYACWSRDFRRAFVRILCVCCPRKIRRKYQPTMRSKASQCHMAAIVAASSSNSSLFEGSHHRRSNSNNSCNNNHRQSSSSSSFGQHYHNHHHHYCNCHFYHRRLTRATGGINRTGSGGSAASSCTNNNGSRRGSNRQHRSSASECCSGGKAGSSGNNNNQNNNGTGNNNVVVGHHRSTGISSEGRQASGGSGKRCTFAPTTTTIPSSSSGGHHNNGGGAGTSRRLGSGRKHQQTLMKPLPPPPSCITPTLIVSRSDPPLATTKSTRTTTLTSASSLSGTGAGAGVQFDDNLHIPTGAAHSPSSDSSTSSLGTLE